MSLKIVYGVLVDANTDIVRKFIRSRMLDDESVPVKVFHFYEAFYNYYVLSEEIDPFEGNNRSIGSHNYEDVFQRAVCWDGPHSDLRAFRPTTSPLSSEWKRKIVIGFQAARINKTNKRPTELPTISDSIVQSVKNNLSLHGFPTTSAKLYVI